jgi:alpha-1,2-mannosyltransferase
MTSAPDPSPRDRAGLIIALIGLIALILYAGSYLALSHPPRDQYGFVLGRDFVNTWMGAKTVLAGHARDVLQVGLHMRRLVDALGAMPPHNWSYPPALFLFIWPLGVLSYLPALAVWSLAGLAAYLGAAATHARSANYLLFVAAAPAIAVNLCSGQTGFFTAALLIVFFRVLDERPLLAGALLGLMLVKPHLVVLFPLALIVGGRWRTFAAAAMMVIVLIAATALAFGADIWSDYFRFVVPVQRGVLDTGTGFLSMMPTGFMHARMLGASNAVAWMVQIPFTLLAVAAVVWTFAKRRDPLLSAGVLLTASVIVGPYAFAYDMVVFGWLVAKLWPRWPGWGDRGLLLTVWTLPVTMLALGEAMLPVAAPILALFLIRLTVQMRPQLPS